MGLVELGGDAHEFLDVLDAAVRLVGVLGLERADEARLADDGVDHLRELARDATTRLDDVAELAERLAHLRREEPRLADALLASGVEAHALVGGELLDLGDRRGADAAARGVDHALDRDVVVGVAHRLEVGGNVADLCAVEEPRAAHDLVRHARAQQHILEDARLRVHAVEHREVVIARARVVQALDLGADPAALVTLVGGLEQLDAVAVARVGKQALGLAARVVGHHGVRGVEDMAGGAVVLLQAHGLGVGIVLLEVEDVLDVGATPRVNGLIVVAHDHEVAVLGGEEVRDGVLDVVGVLVLVHADVLEAVLVLCEHVRVLGKKLEGLDQQVVEVHGVGALQALVERAVDAPRQAIGGVLRALELGRALHGVFRGADLRADGADGELLLVHAQVAHDGLGHAVRVVVIVDGEVVGIPDGLGILAQHAHAHGVEGTDPHASRALGQDGGQTLAHLGRGFVGEGDGQDLPRAHALIGDHVGDAHGEDACLSRAGARQDEQGAARGLHGLALGGVEPVEVDARARSGHGAPHRRRLRHRGRGRHGHGALTGLGRQVGVVGEFHLLVRVHLSGFLSIVLATLECTRTLGQQ